MAQLEAETPNTFKQAVAGHHAQQWRAAAQKEYDTAVKMNTWKVIPRSDLPPGSNVITVKWVFKRKHDASGRPTEFKARMTPHGYKQIEGVDFYETYAQVGMYKTLRVMLALTAHYDLELEQLDVPSAFLNAELDEDIYMELPEGFTIPGKVVKLQKALYGLKQGPRCWWLLVSKFITDTLGYKRSVSDGCFFFRVSQTGHMMYLYLFVDDFQSAFHISDVGEWNRLKQLLIAEYSTKDLGASVWMLGMRISRNRSERTITLDQETYITKALEKFGMDQVKIVSTPEQVGVSESVAPGGALDKPVDAKEFMRIVGTLLYATTSTRLELAHAVQSLSQKSLNPTVRDMLQAKRVLRYLSGSRAIGLKYGGQSANGALVIEAFSDADWANDKVDRKSISGWVVKLNGSPVAWSAKKQKTVALSTCEAELYALGEAIKEILWLQGLLSELGLTVKLPTIAHCDNQSTVLIARNGIKSERTKHIATKWNFIVDTIATDVLRAQWISTVDQQADIFTKPLSREVFTRLRSQLMTS